MLKELGPNLTIDTSHVCMCDTIAPMVRNAICSKHELPCVSVCEVSFGVSKHGGCAEGRGGG